MLTEHAPRARFHARLVNKLTFIQINIIRFDSVTRALELLHMHTISFSRFEPPRF